MFYILTILIILISEIHSKPNVLFVVVDDLRPALGIYGDKNAYTPNIDKLAQKSVVFNNAYAQQALCAPSRNSFLTSRRPDTLHLYDFYSYWRDFAGNFSTLPQHFKENGYYTYSIGKIFHPGISSNGSDDAKYSWSRKPFHPPTETYKDAKVCPTKNGNLAKNLICPIIVEDQPHGILPDMESINAALLFLKNRERYTEGKPYFLAVGFHKPHVPFKFPINYLDYHPLEKINMSSNHRKPSMLPTVAWNPWTDLRYRDDIAALNISFPYGPIPDSVTRRIIQNYNAAVTYVDDLLGSLLKQIDNNTIIVLTGDHGWSMGEHGEFSKFSNFEISVRVPLIIHVPKLNKNTKPLFSNNLVELLDVFPTLVDLSGAESMPECPRNSSNIKLCTEGESLVPLIVSLVNNKEYNGGKQQAFNQYPRPGVTPTKKPNSDKPHLKDINIMGYSMRTSQYRYTEWVEFDPSGLKANWNILHAKELYDHSIDPNEDMNLSSLDEMQNMMKRLSEILRHKFTI